MKYHRVSYNLFYEVDYSDPFFPKIVYCEDQEGKSFGAAQEELLQHIRSKRDHWAAQLREAKKLTCNEVENK